MSKKIDAVKRANSLLKGSLLRCAICPRKCNIDRTKGQKGYCQAPLNPVIYSFMDHHGEEPPLSGIRGSGTIFFSHCNMRCVYCQNYNFSQLDSGKVITVERLAEIMLELQDRRCHNINLVSPTHYVPQIVSALEIAISKGLELPIVYNTGGYDSKETVALLDGVVDIYMPDMRYSDNAKALAFSGAGDYAERNRDSVIEMQRQVGDLVMDWDTIAIRGLIIRFLVLPQDISGAIATLGFIKENISRNAYLSVMSQYYPTFKAYKYKELSRRITRDEYQIIIDEISRLGLNNGWTQLFTDESDGRFLGTNMEPRSF